MKLTTRIRTALHEAGHLVAANGIHDLEPWKAELLAPGSGRCWWMRGSDDEADLAALLAGHLAVAMAAGSADRLESGWLQRCHWLERGDDPDYAPIEEERLLAAGALARETLARDWGRVLDVASTLLVEGKVSAIGGLPGSPRSRVRSWST